MQKKRKVAIFDVDGTIFRSSLLIELVDMMIEQQLFQAGVRSKFETEHRRWLERKGSYEDYIDKVVLVFMENIKGVAYRDLDRVATMVADRYQDRVYRYTRDLVKKLKKQGYFLLAISQSPKGVLDAFCKRLGFNKVYGRFYETDTQERFTGNILELELIRNKGSILKRAIEKEHLTLSGSIGVGDTEGDISFLELVAKPICFNPNHALYIHAKRKKWQVVVERKDVIYQIQ
jgi:HAD superfamily hydrolase (TIGR01490 family)